MAKVEEIITAVEGMSVLELADLVKKLEEKFGVTAAAPMMMAGAMAGSAVGGAEVAVKDEFDEEEAEEMKKKLEAEGAKVEIK